VRSPKSPIPGFFTLTGIWVCVAFLRITPLGELILRSELSVYLHNHWMIFLLNHWMIYLHNHWMIYLLNHWMLYGTPPTVLVLRTFLNTRIEYILTPVIILHASARIAYTFFVLSLSCRCLVVVWSCLVLSCLILSCLALSFLFRSTR
jgi:hypothetical protein